MFQYEILNTPNFNISKTIMNSIVTHIAFIIKKQQNGTINVIFVENEEIKNLNKSYRNIDCVTDVLSFHYFEDFDTLDIKDIAWELIFCEEKIHSQAIEYWLWEEKEFYKLFIHSLLHILWYDHENDWDYEEMQNLENNIWKEIFEKK